MIGDIFETIMMMIVKVTKMIERIKIKNIAKTKLASIVDNSIK